MTGDGPSGKRTGKSAGKRASKQIDTRAHSRLVVDGVKQAPARAMLRAVGFSEGDFAKPQIGVASTWANLTPCNMHIAPLRWRAPRCACCTE